MSFPPPISRHLPSLFRRSSGVAHLLQLHSLLLKTALDRRRRFISRLISSLCPLSLHHARSIFHHLPRSPPIFLWNALIRGYAKSSSPSEAIRFFAELRRAGVEPNSYTYPFVMKACGRSSVVEEGMVVHGLAIKTSFALDSYVGNALLHMYACSRRIGDAQRTFDEMNERDVVSWSSLIEGYVACDRPFDALLVFRQMRWTDIDPNFVTLVSLLTACGRLASLGMGRSIHSYVIVHKIELVVALGTALVGMYAKCGCIDDAFKVFTSIKEKNLQSWTIMISGLADHGRANDAITLFTQMESDGLKPDSVIFSCILSACSHLGLVGKGQYYFNKMVGAYGITPTMEHYGCMVDLFGRAGFVEAAYELIRRMPMAPNGVILRSFLGTCRKYGSIFNLDEKLIKLLLEEEPELGSNYVLAANVSASSGHWNDVDQLRSGMSKRGLKKDPGCSWVDLNAGNVCHAPEGNAEWEEANLVSTMA